MVSWSTINNCVDSRRTDNNRSHNPGSFVSRASPVGNTERSFTSTCGKNRCWNDVNISQFVWLVSTASLKHSSLCLTNGGAEGDYGIKTRWLHSKYSSAIETIRRMWMCDRWFPQEILQMSEMRSRWLFCQCLSVCLIQLMFSGGAPLFSGFSQWLFVDKDYIPVLVYWRIEGYSLSGGGGWFPLNHIAQILLFAVTWIFGEVHYRPYQKGL